MASLFLFCQFFFNSWSQICFNFLVKWKEKKCWHDWYKGENDNG